MPVVDIHHHAVPSGFLEAVRADGGRHGLTLVDRDGSEWLEGQHSEYRSRRSMTDLELRHELARSAGIDIAYTSVLPNLMYYRASPKDGRWISAAMNEGLIADAEASGGWCRPTIHVPLQDPALAARVLVAHVEQTGIRSVSIGTNVAGRNFDDPWLDPFWDAAQGTGALVFVHPAEKELDARLRPYHLGNLIGNPLETTIAIAGLVFGGVLDRFPELKICFAHTGGFVPWIQGRWEHGHGVRKETHVNDIGPSVRDYVSRLYFDTVIHDDRALRFTIDTLGASQLLYGTDCPADMADMDQVPMIQTLGGLSEDERSAILGRNALRLLGLDG